MSRRRALFAVLLATAGAARAADAPVRDPMQPLRHVEGSAGTVAAPRFALTAVLISPTRRVAIVNGKPYQKGETVNGAEIVRIESDAVHLRERGNPIVVPLGHGAAAAKLSQGETSP